MKVYAIGGSVIDDHFDSLEEIAAALETQEQVVAVVGAGHLKKHQDAVRSSANKAETDLVGIAATRFNARTLQALMDDVQPSIPETAEQVKEAASTGKNVVMGGLNPGFSTDAVASMVAELFDAELYIVTDVDGIYTADPGEDGDAEKLDEIEVSELLEMTSGKNTPGTYSIVDETAAKIIQRSGIRTKVFRGTPGNIEEPGDAEGTEVLSR